MPDDLHAFQEPAAVSNLLSAQGAELENVAMLGVVQSVNARTGHIKLISWNHLMVVCDELPQLLEKNALRKSWQVEEDYDETQVQDGDVVVKPGMILPCSVLSVTKQG